MLASAAYWQLWLPGAVQALHGSSLLALTCRGRLFVRLALTQFCDQAVLFDCATKAANRHFERLVFFQKNRRHVIPNSIT